MNQYLTEERTNAGRQHEFDTVKAISIFLMIGIHILENVLTSLESPLAAFFYSGSNKFAAATVFMFMMGAGSVYTKHDSPKDFTERGILLLTFGWMLNFIRYFAMDAIGYCLFREQSSLNHMTLFLSGDIMQFAGLAFFTLALFRKAGFSSLKMLLTAIVMSILGTALAGRQTGSYPVDQLIGFFWGTYSESYFPLLSWFIFVAAGRCYGELYIRLRDKRQWHLHTVPFGLAASIAYIILAGKQQRIFLIGSEMTGYCWMRLPDAAGCILIAMTLAGLIFLLSGGKKIALCSEISGNINKYYCVSWALIVILFYSTDYVTYKNNNMMFLAMLAGVFLLTMLIIRTYQKNMEQRFAAFFGRHKAFWLCFVWIAAICITVFSFTAATEYPNMFNGYLLDLRA